MNTVIKVDNLSKKYIISHHVKEPYQTLRDTVARKSREIGKRLLHPFLASSARSFSGTEDFWALKDVSFEVQQGDRLGIIGRNGAGKSTLLKVLSRITEPTKGRVHIKGRVASLLEVGTGFHPELTGRENIFLNGAILGMGKAEIKKKFDEIVAFAEMEKFLDTPVKHYSSGMYVRLAFAVAAHLEPEILIVDEVLAVGDAQFQNKCLGRMQEVGDEGRTVLFVSHNMEAIKQFCSRAIRFDNGSLLDQSEDVYAVIDRYLNVRGTTEAQWINNLQISNERIIPQKIYITGNNDKIIDFPLNRNDEAWLTIEFDLLVYRQSLVLGYDLYSETGGLLYRSCFTDMPPKDWCRVKAGRNIIRSRLPLHILNEGTYKIDFICAYREDAWIFKPGGDNPKIFFEIMGGLSESPYWIKKRPGAIAPVTVWKDI
jgi:lipopolysaccharide transport system ATP-binding protein